MTNFALMINHLKYELQNVISGKSQVRYGTIIQSVASHLGNSTKSSPKSQVSKQVKNQEIERLTEVINNKNLWVQNIDFTKFISQGAEQRVFFKDEFSVLKLNDSIYYSSWLDYFYNILVHNFFFPDTAYNLIGFIRENNVHYAVVMQQFVKLTEQTSLKSVKEFLNHNGFQSTKNNDYINNDLGIILEDLHDENVLTRNGVLYFIDTVFYLTEDFWISK